MPRDKTANHGKIVSAAFREFLDHGYQEASMRRIASACEMSAAGLYKHFSGKEAMFAALVDPALNGLMELMTQIEGNDSEELAGVCSGSFWINQNETVQAMEYIYRHFDEFKLIICRSQGTRYESLTHDLARLEEEVTFRYMEMLSEKGIRVNEVDEKEFHLLATAHVEAIFQAVIHDFSEEEAMHYAHTLEKFYQPAWKALFGLS